MWFATVPRRPGFAHAAEEYVRAFLIQKFGGWHDPILQLLEGTDPSEIVNEDAYAHTHFDGFSKGACTLIGDAAHTVNVFSGKEPWCTITFVVKKKKHCEWSLSLLYSLYSLYPVLLLGSWTLF